MNPKPHGGSTKGSVEDEALSGLALSLVLAPVCALFAGGLVWLLAPPALAPLAWFLPWWRRARPPRALIGLGKFLILLAGAFWLASILFNITFRVSGTEAWVFGMGQVEHVRYRGKAPFAANGPVTIGIKSLPNTPYALISSLLFGGRSMADGRGFSSFSEAWPTLPPLICVLMPTWVLHRLRRSRRPTWRCARCEYDLTGNTSGRCPECGRPFSHD